MLLADIFTLAQNIAPCCTIGFKMYFCSSVYLCLDCADHGFLYRFQAIYLWSQHPGGPGKTLQN